MILKTSSQSQMTLNLLKLYFWSWIWDSISNSSSAGCYRYFLRIVNNVTVSVRLANTGSDVYGCIRLFSIDGCFSLPATLTGCCVNQLRSNRDNKHVPLIYRKSSLFVCSYRMFISAVLGGAEMKDGDSTEKYSAAHPGKAWNKCLRYVDVAGLTGFGTLRQAGVKDGWFQSERDIKHPFRESNNASLAVAASTLPWHHRLGDTAAIISILQLYLKPALIKISSWTAVKQKLLHKDLFQHFLLDLC